MDEDEGSESGTFQPLPQLDGDAHKESNPLAVVEMKGLLTEEDLPRASSEEETCRYVLWPI